MVNCCLSVPEHGDFPSFPPAAERCGFNSVGFLCRCSPSSLVFSDYSRITVGCTGCRADNQPLTVPFHSADVFISAALSQSCLLNLKTLFTIKSNYSAWLHWGIEPCPRCFLRLPAPSAESPRVPPPACSQRLQHDMVADRCSSDGAFASPKPAAYLINAGSAGTRRFITAGSNPDWIGRGVGGGCGCYCN